jgi:hypothetical protein
VAWHVTVFWAVAKNHNANADQVSGDLNLAPSGKSKVSNLVNGRCLDLSGHCLSCNTMWLFLCKFVPVFFLASTIDLCALARTVRVLELESWVAILTQVGSGCPRPVVAQAKTLSRRRLPMVDLATSTKCRPADATYSTRFCEGSLQVHAEENFGGVYDWLGSVGAHRRPGAGLEEWASDDP